MSCRHPIMTRNAASSRSRLERNIHYLLRIQAFQKLPRGVWVELWIRCLYAQEESVSGGARESFDVEYGVIRLRQSVEHEHANHSSDTCNQHHEFERNRNVGRPGVQWPSCNVVRIGDHTDPPTQHEAADCTAQTSHEDQALHPVTAEANGLRQAFHGHRSIGVHLPVTFEASPIGGVEQRLRIVELGHDAIEAFDLPGHFNLREHALAPCRYGVPPRASRKWK